MTDIQKHEAHRNCIHISLRVDCVVLHVVTVTGPKAIVGKFLSAPLEAFLNNRQTHPEKLVPLI